MPKQINYVQLVPSNPKTFPVSRIAESEVDSEILQGRLAGEFGFSGTDNIEMHFYDYNNALVGSVVIPVSTGIVSAKTLILPDGTREEKILVDMTRVQKELGLLISPGNYTIVLNFFSDEIGSYLNKKLVIEEVSLSRTELRVGYNFTPAGEEDSELFEFVQPSVPRVVSAGIMESVMGIATGNIFTEGQAETSSQMQEFITKIVDELLKDDIQVIAAMNDLEVYTYDNFQLTVETIAVETYREFIRLLEATKQLNTFDRIQQAEMIDLVEIALDNALKRININAYTGGQIQYV